MWPFAAALTSSRFSIFAETITFTTVSVSISWSSPLRDVHELIGIIQGPAEGGGAVGSDQLDGGGPVDGRRRTTEGQSESAVGLAARVGAGLGPEAVGEGLRLLEDEGAIEEVE